jgi:hypothetical protein
VVILAPVLALIAGAGDACHEHYAALRYRDAITACTEALTSGDADRSELYVLIGLSLAGTGEADKARRVFAALLALKPLVELPAGLSPKLRAPFEAAKDDATVIRLEASVDGAPGSTLSVTARVNDGASKPVAELALSAGDRLARMRRADPTRLALPWPPAGGQATLFAYDVLGGELASTPVPLLIPPAAAVESRPLVLSWKAWLAGSLVLAALGGAALGWAAGDFPRARGESWADTAQGIAREGTTAQAISAVGFGLAAATALVGVILGVTE